MLKPIQNFVDLLDYTFQEGGCKCMRCDSGESNVFYLTPHNFTIDGVVYRRQFAKSSKEDLNDNLRAALKAKYKDEINISEPIHTSVIKSLMSEKEYGRFILLGKNNGLINSVESGLINLN
mgnify:CR=1 FL=1